MYSCLGLQFSSIGLHVVVVVVVWKWLDKGFCDGNEMVLERFISFFLHCSDQTPEKMQLKGGRAHFGSWLEGTVHHSRGCTAVGRLGLWQQQPYVLTSGENRKQTGQKAGRVGLWISTLLSCQATRFPPAGIYLLKLSPPSKLAPVAGDQEFWHTSLMRDIFPSNSP